MSDTPQEESTEIEEVKPEDSSQDDQSQENAPKVSAGNTVLTSIAARVKNAGSEIQERVENILYEREVESRSNKLVKALDKLVAEESELRKLDRPDQKFFDDKGDTTLQVYTEDRKKQLEEKRKKLGKLKKQINGAIQSGNFNELPS